jgi:hypothetical protein
VAAKGDEKDLGGDLGPEIQSGRNELKVLPPFWKNKCNITW